MAGEGVTTEKVAPPLMADSAADVVNSNAQASAEFYDAFTQLWLELYGPHVHVGYFDNPKKPCGKSLEQGQAELIDRALAFADVKSAKQALDVGCGLGGTACSLANKLDCAVVGVNISPAQVAAANELATVLAPGRAHFIVGDALALPLARQSVLSSGDVSSGASIGSDSVCASGGALSEASFDLVVSVEASIYMPDKWRFVTELARAAAPGARIILVDFTRAPGELSRTQRRTLAAFTREFKAAQDWSSAADLKRLMEDAGLEDVRSVDWTQHVRGFWWQPWWSMLQTPPPGQEPPRGLMRCTRAVVGKWARCIKLWCRSAATAGLAAACLMSKAAALPARTHCIERCLRNGGVRYVVVCATKPVAGAP